ncbi:MAG: zinc-ribbon domain-containing protein [Thermoleophilia bacterium]
MTDAPAPPPDEPTPAEPTCPECGAPHEPDQEYCLECGARLPSPWGEPPRSPAWVWGVIGALALVALVSGIVVAVLASRDDQRRSAPALSALPVAPPPAAPAPAPAPVPTDGVTDLAVDTAGIETITIGSIPETTPGPPAGLTEPPFTDTSPFPTGTDAFPTTEPFPGLTDTEPFPVTPPSFPEPPPPAGLSDWPAGTSGYTVILSSVTLAEGRPLAEQQAQSAVLSGLSGVGILESSQFSSLRPGFYVVFTGVFTTLDEAQGTLQQARSAGFPTAYTRRIRP